MGRPEEKEDVVKSTTGATGLTMGKEEVDPVRSTTEVSIESSRDILANCRRS